MLTRGRVRDYMSVNEVVGVSHLLRIPATDVVKQRIQDQRFGHIVLDTAEASCLFSQRVVLRIKSHVGLQVVNVIPFPDLVELLRVHRLRITLLAPYHRDICLDQERLANAHGGLLSSFLTGELGSRSQERIPALERNTTSNALINRVFVQSAEHFFEFLIFGLENCFFTGVPAVDHHMVVRSTAHSIHVVVAWPRGQLDRLGGDLDVATQTALREASVSH